MTPTPLSSDPNAYRCVNLTRGEPAPLTDAAWQVMLRSNCLPECDSIAHAEMCPYANGDIVMMKFAQGLEARLRAAERALTEVRDSVGPHQDDDGNEIEQDTECFCPRCIAVRALIPQLPS